MGLRELATKEKLGGVSDGALTQLLKLIEEYYLKSMQDTIQASYTIVRRRPKTWPQLISKWFIIMMLF